MSLHLYPIDHLPVGAVNAGRTIPGNQNNLGGGGLRLTDYELFGNLLDSPGGRLHDVQIISSHGTKYLRTSSVWSINQGFGYGLMFPISNISPDATRVFFGYRLTKRGVSSSSQIPLGLFTEPNNFHYQDRYASLITAAELGAWVPNEDLFIEVSLLINSHADGVVRRWINGRRLPDIVITSTYIPVSRLTSSWIKFVPTSGDGDIRTPIRDIYLAADDGDNPVTTRLGAIRETQLPVTVEQADGWVSDSTDTVEEFLNLPMSNTAPFDGTIKTTTLAPLSYKADTSQLKDTDIIVGVVGAISNSRDAGMLIQQTTAVTGTDISTTDTQDLATVPFLLNTYINPNQFDTQFPFTKEQVGSIVTTLSYDVIDED